MAERVYTTEGIILRRRSLGEGNVVVSLLTEELGLVEASARSGREERSKLRFGLSVLAHGEYSLIAGNHTFKLIGASADGIFGNKGNRASVQAMGKVSALLLRLVPREEPAPILFAFLARGFACLATEANEEKMRAIEGILVLRSLHELGYVPYSDELSPFFSAHSADPGLIEAFMPLRSKAIGAINAALSASGL